MNENLPNMHDEKNNALVRLLSERLSGVRSGAGHISQALQEFAGGALTPDDAAGVVGQSGDIGGSESGGVKV